MLTVMLLLAILTLLLVVASAASSKVPLWVPVLLLAVIELLRVVPLR